MSRHPVIDRVLAEGAPDPLRFAAARGSVPLPPGELLFLLVRLVSDEDASIRQTAEQTLADFDSDRLRESLADPGIDATVLDYLLVTKGLEGETRYTAMINPAVSNETLVSLADTTDDHVIETLLSNQERLIACPEIAHALGSNPALDVGQKSRLEEFRRRFLADSTTAGDAPAAISDSDLVSTEELEGMIGELGSLPFLSVDLDDLMGSEGMSGDVGDLLAGDADMESVFSRLSQMNGAQRLKAALRGGREERTLLIRDSNRIVAAAVLKNPRITEQEAETISALRSVSEDILRLISARRDWMRNYSILKQLVRNPKTPPGTAMNHINRLSLRDLQQILRDRNVSEVVRRLARRQVDSRQNRSDSGGRRRH